MATDIGVMIESASFEDDIDEVTIIESSSERTVSKCCRSVVWDYFNKLPGEDAGSKRMLCAYVLRDCGNTTRK